MKTKILLTFFLIFAAAPMLQAEPVVVSDAQVISLGENDYLLKVRSSGPQAFDAEKDGEATRITLYQARLGTLPELSPTPFGAILFGEDGDGNVTISLITDPAYRVSVQQGGDSASVEVRFIWAPDTSSPVLSEIRASSITASGAVLTWTTDEPSDSSAVYGPAQPETLETAIQGSLVNDHEVLLSGLEPGKMYYYRVRSRDAAGNPAISGSSFFTTEDAVFQESGGQVVLEAEHFDSRIDRGGKSWTLETQSGGYSGAGYMAALPNTGFYMTSGFTSAVSELVYKVNFSTTGTYYIWMRGRGNDGTDDSVHAGLDGVSPSSANGVTGFVSGWSWQRKTMNLPAASLVVSTPGVHTFHVWIREDGTQIDKILLRKNASSTAPGGQGPAESSRSA